MKYLIVPELIYIVLLYGGIALSLISVFMEIRGMIEKKGRGYFIKWCVVLLVSFVAVALTTGVVVAQTMIGG
jgi:hypothetical protein